MERSNDDDKQLMKKKGKKNQIIYKSNPSTQLLVEETFKIILNKSKGLGYKEVRTKMAPRNKHSAFGDFPGDFMPKKQETYDLDQIDTHQVSTNYRLGMDNKTLSRQSKTKSVKKSIRPPISGSMEPRKIPVSSFRLHYDRGDLPIIIEHVNGYKILWKDEDFDNFNYQLYLPIFIEGIRETTDPYRFLAIQGTFDLLGKIKDTILKVISQIIFPLKRALNTRDPEIIIITLKVRFWIKTFLDYSKNRNLQ